ncbi:MAG: hypothetical protein ACP5D6_06465 [Kosmotogaceae bacterium]
MKGSMETIPKRNQKLIFVLLSLPDGDFIMMSKENLFMVYKTPADAQVQCLKIENTAPEGVNTNILEMTYKELRTLFDNEAFDVQIKKSGLHLAKITHKENINQYVFKEKTDDIK